MQVNSRDLITQLDYPDPDVIRVDDTYYMVSTTMHFMPGCEILRSYDLVHWEHLTYVYDRLDSTEGQRLCGDENCYGKGMWAASLRYHKGKFYVCFVANDTGKTYLYTAEAIMGPWKKQTMEGFYHDCSLLFDEDERVYIIYGNTTIRIKELKPDLSGPKPDGLSRVLVSEENNMQLGFEGSHMYRIYGRYYLFLIHSLPDRWMRTEACYAADSLTGVFEGVDVLQDTMGYCGQGVAQGGIVDTPDGNWYAMLFQDRGAVGRIPVLLPVHWMGKIPVFGEDGHVPERFEVNDFRPGYRYAPLVSSDDFKESRPEDRQHFGTFGLKSVWQFNHEPELSLLRQDTGKGTVTMICGKICSHVTEAVNTLTQRMKYPCCAAEITVDASGLKEGDYAGLCALQGCYGLVALTRQKESCYVVMRTREADQEGFEAGEKDSWEETEWEAVRVDDMQIRFRAEADFLNQRDEVRFFYERNGAWKPIGPVHKLYFKLDHFTGCRFGLFAYATAETGGSAVFSDFRYLE